MTSNLAEVDITNLEDSNLEFTILMPCLNEERTIADCVQKARQFLRRYGIRGEVLVADNGSTDCSVRIAESEGARVVHVQQRGYGAALFHGSLAARGRYIIMGDADCSYDFSKLEGFVEKLRAGNDLVMGNRFKGGVAKGAMPWKNRYIGNPILSAVGRTLFSSAIGDFHCGLRGFSKESFLKLDLRTPGMEYASEMVIKATLKGLKMAEVPTTLSPDKRGRAPHLRPWRDGWRHLRFMLLFSPRWLFLYPGILTFVICSLLTLRLLYAPILIGSIELDVHTLLFAACGMLLGFQSISFAVFSKSYAVKEKLIPPSPSYKLIEKFLSLELLVLSGVAILGLGFVLAVFAVLDWNAAGFGGLDVRNTLRLVVPSVLCMALGVQVAMLGLLLGVLTLKSRNQ